MAGRPPAVLCKNNHDDWYVMGNGKRRCRTCKRAKAKEYEAAYRLERAASRRRSRAAAGRSDATNWAGGPKTGNTAGLGLTMGYTREEIMRYRETH